MFGAGGMREKLIIFTEQGWAQEAYAYNSLVIAWPEVQTKAAELAAQSNSGEQLNLFGMEEGK
jgi:putative DNA methylase